jgi:hypothetical protein
MARYAQAADPEQKLFATLPLVVASGGAAVVDARGMRQLTIITGAGTATLSRVDSEGAAADAPEVAGNATVATGTRLVVAVDWPFYRITAAGGDARVACV